MTSGQYPSQEYVDALASQVAALDISNNYLRFEWQGERLPTAWEMRRSLEEAFREPNDAGYKNWADSVHEWGFGGRKISTRIQNNLDFYPALETTLRVWRDGRTDPRNAKAKIDSLATLLSIPSVGIAVASKWLCFIDQNAYAIYDSRVSLALRNVTTNGRRAFPIVGRRSLKAKKAWAADNAALRPKRMAEYYWTYLLVVNRAAQLVSTQPHAQRIYRAAEIEMALFMEGDVWPDRVERLPLTRI